MAKLTRHRRFSPSIENNAALRESADDESPDSSLLDNPPESSDDFNAASEADELNDPDVTHLGAPPIVGGRGRTSDLFGEEAEHAAGRATSPKLYAQAAQFPTCTQLRCWKWENGLPVGLGTIDSTATEEDFVRQFYTAMPRKGEGRAQFKLRPIDIRGHELGQEITTVISEHHAALRGIREAEEDRSTGLPPMPVGTDMNGEMSRMVEHMLATAEARARALEESLEAERERMREEELRKAQERIDLAQSAAQGVQAITERMMKDDHVRQERAMQMQTQQSQLLITTLTQIFSQSQTMTQQAEESRRRQDEMRLEQERQRAERERTNLEEQRRRDREEWEFKRKREQEEADYRIRLEREEAERKMTREREEMDRRERREKEEREARERWFSEERARREAIEREDIRQRDAERERQHALRMKEMEVQAQRDREHAEKMLLLSQQTNSNDVLGNAAKMLGQFGIAPNEILPRLFGIGAKAEEDDDKPSPWLEALPKIVGVVSEVARASMQAKPPAPPPMPRPALPPPYGGMPMPPPPPPPREREPIVTPPPAEAQQAPPPPPAPTVNLSEIAASKGVGLKAQKAARGAIRALVKQLSVAPEDKWEELISMAIGNEMAIYHYANAVSVKAAMLENGATPELTQKVIDGMRTSSFIQSLASDLYYGDDE